ncbi:MAG: ABC transporter permease, partial [Gluconobacter japonicus]
MALLSDLLGHAVLSGSVLALGALGEVIAERAGVLDLGVEGLMSLGAVVARHTLPATPQPNQWRRGGRFCGWGGCGLFARCNVG